MLKKEARFGVDDESSGETDDDQHGLPRLEHFPSSQIRGDAWVVGVLDDLIAYSEHRSMSELTDALRHAHASAVKSCLH